MEGVTFKGALGKISQVIQDKVGLNFEPTSPFLPIVMKLRPQDPLWPIDTQTRLLDRKSVFL